MNIIVWRAFEPCNHPAITRLYTHSHNPRAPTPRTPHAITCEYPVSNLNAPCAMRFLYVSCELSERHTMSPVNSHTCEIPVNPLSVSWVSVSCEFPVNSLSVCCVSVSCEFPVNSLSVCCVSVCCEIPVNSLSVCWVNVCCEIPVNSLNTTCASRPLVFPVRFL